MNDNLCHELTHVAYSSVEDAAHLMHYIGPNALLAKMGIKQAYRLIPICPQDCIFQGIQWRGLIYIDCQLPFDLALAPTIFSELSEVLEWVLRKRRVRAVIHYMDDFLFMGASSTSECSQALAVNISSTIHTLVATSYGGLAR